MIYRQDAIDAIEKLDIPEDMCVFEILSHIELAIGTLPSAEPCDNCIHDDEDWDSEACDGCISAEPNILNDDTLTITVQHGMLSKVNRVIVDEVGTKFCKMMYQDAVPSAERTGKWIPYGIARYRCSNCGKVQCGDRDSDLNYCCNCGSRNEVSEDD